MGGMVCLWQCSFQLLEHGVEKVTEEYKLMYILYNTLSARECIGPHV